MNPRAPRASGARTTEPLVQLDASCPSCGKREARRVALWRLELYKALDPERICDTIICKCGTEYIILAKAYQGAA